MTTFKGYIANNFDREQSSIPRRAMREDDGDVRVVSSLGLDAASVALPAGISLDDRASRMNAFWRALVDYQYRDVVVVALCSGEKR